jgi:hypothetical protein
VCAESVEGTEEHSEHSVGFLHRYANFVSRVAEFRISNIQNSLGSIETAYMLIYVQKVFWVLLVYRGFITLLSSNCYGDMQGKQAEISCASFLEPWSLLRFFTHGQQQASEEPR